MALENCIISRSFKLLFFLLLTFGLFISPVLSAEANQKSNIIRVGYFENEIFQEGAREGVIKTGYAYDYYRKLSEYTGWKYEYVYGEFNELYQKLLKGEVDLMAGLAYNKERADLLLYPEMSMGNTSYFLIKKNTDTSISTKLSTLNNKTIATLDSNMVTVLKNWLVANNLNTQIKVYDNQEDVYRVFYANKSDMVFLEGSGAYDREDADPFIKVGKTDYYLCVTKNKPELLEQLNEAQSQIIFDNPYYLDGLNSKYYSLSISSKVLSEIETKWISEHSELKIGFLKNYLPYSNIDSNGEAYGLVKDLIPEILEVLNIKNQISIKYLPYENTSSMIKDLSSDVIDVAFPIGGGLYFSEQNDIYKSQSVVKTSVNLVFNSKSNLEKPDCFAVNKKNIMQENYVKSVFPDAKIIYCDSIDDCLRTVKKSKNVCTTVNGLRTYSLLKNAKFRSLGYRTLNIDDERCFGVKVGNEGLLRLLNRGLNNISEQHILDAAYQYTDGLYKYTIVDFLINNSIFITLAILIIVMITMHFFFYDSKKKKAYLKIETKKNEELNLIQENLRIQLDKVKNLNLQLKHSHDDTFRYITDMIRFASSQDSGDEIINQLINYISEKIECDRIYIFERNLKGSYDNTYEWCNKGVTAEKDSLQDVPYDDVIEVWCNEFKKSGALIIKNLEAYKEVSEPIYAILKPQHINSLVAVPLYEEGQISGFLGIDNPPVKNIEYISDLLSMVEFMFSMMIRIRNNTNAIAESAIHDQLTGCLNRKALVWAYEGKYQENVSCGIVSVDMNGLKKVNDSQGHSAGDKFICRMAETLKDVYGEKNVYRMGGDEFVVVLIGVTKEKFTKLLDDCKILVGNTASLGGVFEETLEKGFDELLRKSDKDMYHQKDLFYQNKRNTN